MPNFVIRLPGAGKAREDVLSARMVREVERTGWALMHHVGHLTPGEER